LYSKILRIYGPKIRKVTKITDLPDELLLGILKDDCLEKEDIKNVTLACRKLGKSATSLLFHTLSSTVLEDSSFDMRWHDLQEDDKLRELVQVVRLKPSYRRASPRGVSRSTSVQSKELESRLTGILRIDHWRTCEHKAY
jgi:hypothetical protein